VKQFFLPLAALVVICTSSCDSCPEPDPQTYESGVFINNEGQYGGAPGTLTFQSTAGATTQDVFGIENDGAAVGGTFQSMSANDNKLFFISNEGGQLLVSDAKTLKITHTVGDLQSPRFYLPINSTRGLISEWRDALGNGRISVYNPTTKAITGTYETSGPGPEEMLAHGGLVYTPMSGGYSNSNIIEVRNALNDELVNTLTLGRYNPVKLTETTNNDLWVVCRGYGEFANTQPYHFGALYKFETGINTATDSIILESINCTDLTYNADADELYVLDNGAFKAFNASTLIETTGNYANDLTGGYWYALSYHNGKIYTTDAKDYASAGEAFIWSYAAGTATFSSKFTTGIIPGGFLFVD
jgi:hypothetical protein